MLSAADRYCNIDNDVLCPRKATANPLPNIKELPDTNKIIMKKLLLSLSFLLASVFVYSQITFERHYDCTGHNGGTDVLQTDDGGYLVATQYLCLIKTDQYGDTLWTKCLGGNLGQNFFSLKKTNDNCFIACGSSHGFGLYGSNYWLAKFNANGDTIWQKGYGGYGDEDAYDVIQTSDGGFALVGASTSFGGAIYFVKTDNQGDTLWTKLYSKSYTSFANSLIQLADNGYVIVGETGIGSVNRNLLVIRTNMNGDTIWMKTFGGNNNEVGYSVKETDDGGFIISGATKSFGLGGYDVYLIKIHSNGLIQWTKTIGGINDDSGGECVLTSDGGYAVAGSTNSFGSGNYDAYLLKLNSIGDTLWSKTFGGLGIDAAGYIKETTDGGFIIAGRTESYGGNSDVYLIKTDANGQVAGIDDYPSMYNGITVYPNPTTRQVNIQIPKQFGQTKTLEVFDFVGQLQLSKTDNFSEIDISSLTSGLYFIVVTNTDNERQTFKIIKD